MGSRGIKPAYLLRKIFQLMFLGSDQMEANWKLGCDHGEHKREDQERDTCRIGNRKDLLQQDWLRGGNSHNLAAVSNRWQNSRRQQ